jgi:CheY-like chemotaxis protein
MMLNQTTVLYVDDNPKSSRLLTGILEDCGFRVITKNDPLQAIAFCAGSDSGKTSFDLALLDYEMPAMSGSVLAQKLKSMVPEIPVLLLSSRTTMPDAELRFVDAHFGFGTKLDELIWSIRIMVQHPKLVMAETEPSHIAANHENGSRIPNSAVIGTQREITRWADCT